MFTGMLFKAAIFDLDGTLVDSYKAWEKAYKKVLRASGYDLTDEDFLELYHMTLEESGAYFRTLYEAGKIDIPGAERVPGDTGMSGADSEAREARGTVRGGAPYTDLFETFTRGIFHSIRKEMETLYAEEVPGKPHALEYVRSLYEKGVPACVATLTGSVLSVPSLKKTGFFPFLKFVVTSDDVGLSKKFPDIFLEAAKRMGVTPRETVVFEDCPTAMKTAYDAGFQVCGVADLHRVYDSAEVSRRCGWFITDFHDAPDPGVL